jgi:hypothetical protein
MVAGAARVSDATVTPKVSGLGLSRARENGGGDEHRQHRYLRRLLQPAECRSLHDQSVIRGPGSPQPVLVDFKYDHRR